MRWVIFYQKLLEIYLVKSFQKAQPFPSDCWLLTTYMQCPRFFFKWDTWAIWLHKCHNSMRIQHNTFPRNLRASWGWDFQVTRAKKNGLGRWESGWIPGPFLQLAPSPPSSTHLSSLPSLPRPRAQWELLSVSLGLAVPLSAFFNWTVYLLPICYTLPTLEVLGSNFVPLFEASTII